MSRIDVRRPRRLAVAAVGLGVVLTACGGGSGPHSSASATTTATKAATASSASSDAASPGTPLEQLFAGDSGSQRAMEDEVASCMREHGWQYTPSPDVATSSSFLSSDNATFRSQYGYGISTQPPPEAFGLSVPSDAGADPNGTYLATLSDADRTRYEKDLSGGAVEALSASDGGDTNPAAVPVGAPDPNSCTAKAQVVVGKKFPQMSTEFQKRLQELFMAADDDPRMRDAQRKWSVCMAKANFTYDKPQDAFADLSKRATDLGVHSVASNSDTAGGGAIVISGGPAQGGSPTTTRNAGDQERLTKLQRDERAIAKADSACSKDTIDKVRTAVEQDIVNKLRSEFPSIGNGK